MTEIRQENVCPAQPEFENRFRRNWAKLKRNKAALAGGIMLLV